MAVVARRRVLHAPSPSVHLQFVRSSVSIRRWTYVNYCWSTMAQKLFSTGLGRLGGQNKKRRRTVFGKAIEVAQSFRLQSQSNVRSSARTSKTSQIRIITIILASCNYPE